VTRRIVKARNPLVGLPVVTGDVVWNADMKPIRQAWVKRKPQHRSNVRQTVVPADGDSSNCIHMQGGCGKGAVVTVINRPGHSTITQIDTTGKGPRDNQMTGDDDDDDGEEREEEQEKEMQAANAATGAPDSEGSAGAAEETEDISFNGPPSQKAAFLKHEAEKEAEKEGKAVPKKKCNKKRKLEAVKEGEEAEEQAEQEEGDCEERPSPRQMSAPQPIIIIQAPQPPPESVMHTIAAVLKPVVIQAPKSIGPLSSSHRQQQQQQPTRPLAAQCSCGQNSNNPILSRIDRLLARINSSMGNMCNNNESNQSSAGCDQASLLQYFARSCTC